MTDWSQRTLHFIGIGGAGMSGLALVCRRLGAQVSGSDRAQSLIPGAPAGGRCRSSRSHDAGAVPPDAEVVISTAIGEDNPELPCARERGQPVIHRGELLAELCAEKRLLAIAGTHGKTTTAGMVAHALRATGADPGFLLGGELPGAGEDGGPGNAGWGTGEWVVAEADESDASFLRLRPEVAAVTNVELDHHSHWSSTRRAARCLPPLLRARAWAWRCRATAAWLAWPASRGSWPSTRTPGPALDLRVPGRHNLLNARAALAALSSAGFALEPAAVGLSFFPGMLAASSSRAMATGPSSMTTTPIIRPRWPRRCAALRELGPRRLMAVFQPHLYSRTKALAERFGLALATADKVGVLDVYPAREEPTGRLAGVSGLAVAGPPPRRASGRPSVARGR